MAVLFILLALIMPNLMMSSVQSFHGQRLLNVLMAVNRQTATQELASEIERFHRQTGQYPATLAALAATSGFEQDGGFISTPGINYTLAPVTDSVWSFNRALIAGLDVRHTTLASFLASNTCGTGSFSVASDWCGGTQAGDWYKTEERAVFMNEATQARSRLNQTLMKFVALWNTTGSFPAGTLSVGGSTSLAALAGATGVTASSCTGVYMFSGVPLECSDLFTLWGDLVVYNYIGPSYIAIIAITPNTYSAGGRQYVAAEMHF